MTMKSKTSKKENMFLNSNLNLPTSVNHQHHRHQNLHNHAQYPPYYHLKKTFLQIFISLDTFSWIVFDLFVQYYAEQFVRLNTSAQVETDEFYHLKVNILAIYNFN